MMHVHDSLKLYINLSKIVTENSRRFSGGLDGLGFTEFVILFHLFHAPDKKMRRIDLADKIGLTLIARVRGDKMSIYTHPERVAIECGDDFKS